MDFVQDADLTWLVAALIALIISPLWDKLNQWLSGLNEQAEIEA